MRSLHTHTHTQRAYIQTHTTTGTDRLMPDTSFKLRILTFWRRIFFQILAHPVFKM